ncbi:MAG: S9 family peptidase [Caulobacter sp.]|nr:S9 family peptidase [Caulobacter sp.]
MRAKRSSSWKLFDRARYDLPLDQAVQGYSDPDDAIVLLRATGEGVEVVSRKLADGTETVLGPQIPSLHPEVVWDPYLSAPVAIVTGEERPVYQWLDPQLGAVHAKLGRVFKGKSVLLSSWSRDRSRYLIRVDAPDTVPQWLLFETAGNQVSPIGHEYPDLSEAPMGSTRWLTYKARDGLEIPAYLTLPPGLAAGIKPPLVVLPHGGPAARDEFEFDWWAQFLASRGYAVLRPQFRGSEGFGAAFERAGDGEWGGKMQTDLLDGVAQLAKDGVIDPKRVCIVGASYGGYAALAGVSLHPDDYRCAVSVAGISDIGLMLLDTRRAGGADSPGLQYWRRVAGDSRATPGILAATSPAKQAAKIKAPVLLIHGAEDTVVDINQSRTMEAAMKASRGDVQFVVLPGDDHYLSSSETRTRMLEAVDVFLAKHLPVAP